MPETSKGFPYPDGAVDKLADTDLAIKALADYLNANNGRIKAGTSAVDIITTNVVATQAVVFATPYPVGVTPVVLLTVRTTAVGTRFVAVQSESNTGFTVEGINTASNSDVGFSWLAIG